MFNVFTLTNSSCWEAVSIINNIVRIILLIEYQYRLYRENFKGASIVTEVQRQYDYECDLYSLFYVCQMQDKLVRVQESHGAEIEGMKKELASITNHDPGPSSIRDQRGYDYKCDLFLFILRLSDAG